MKHVLAYFFAAVFLVAGGVLLWENRQHPPTPILLGGIGLMAFAALLAAPASAREAIETVAPYLPSPFKRSPSALPQATAAPEVAHDE